MKKGRNCLTRAGSEFSVSPVQIPDPDSNSALGSNSHDMKLSLSS